MKATAEVLSASLGAVEDFADTSAILTDTEAMLKQKIDELPINLTVKDVARFLGVSLTTAYNIVDEPGFPLKTMKGTSRKIIPKLKFVKWYLE